LVQVPTLDRNSQQQLGQANAIQAFSGRSISEMINSASNKQLISADAPYSRIAMLHLYKSQSFFLNVYSFIGRQIVETARTNHEK